MISVLTIAVSSVLKGLSLLALIGGGVLAGGLAVLAVGAALAAALALGLLAGTAGLALVLLIVFLVVGALLLPLAAPLLVLYLLVRPRRRAPAL